MERNLRAIGAMAVAIVFMMWIIAPAGDLFVLFWRVVY